MDANTKNKYSAEELKEFERILQAKLTQAYQELEFIQKTLSKDTENAVNTSSKLFDDISDTLEKENLSALISHQRKYIVHIENALIRIKNGTYGICFVTGALIDKERLTLVPHSRHSAEAKRDKEAKAK
jgi:DnaK suppressor protein